MGYTHYWTQRRSFTSEEWSDICTDIAAILVHVEHGLDVPLANGLADKGTHPEITPTRIAFNGAGEEDGHETFAITRKRVRQWEGDELGEDACKTAQKPYDVAVTACLCYLSSVVGEYHVTSDGRGADFLAGLAAARTALPNKANILDIPMGVMQRDRWTGPWVSGESGTGYEVHFCVNGKGYVQKLKTKDWYCFSTHADLARFLDQHKAATFKRGGNMRRWNYGRTEPNIWHATGSFDKARHQRIARAQNKVLAPLFPVPAEHAEPPPAYVRPNEIPSREEMPFHYSLRDLLQSLEEKAA